MFRKLDLFPSSAVEREREREGWGTSSVGTLRQLTSITVPSHRVFQKELYNF
jgi:hypothetical protein